MNQRINVILAVAAAVGACVLGVLLWAPGRPSGFPAVSLAAVEPEAAEQIRALEAELDPGDQESWLTLAGVYRAFALLPAADLCFRHAESLAPLDAAAEFAWGATLSRLGQMEEALPRLQSARRRGFEPVQAIDLMVAKDALRSGDLERAEAVLRRMERDGSVVAGVWLCRLLIRDGRAEVALEALDGLLARNRGELRLHQLASWAHASLGHPGRAEEHRLFGAYCKDTTTRSELSQDEDTATRRRFGSDRSIQEAQRKLAGEAGTSEVTALLMDIFRATGNQDIALQAAQHHHAGGEFDRATEILAEMTATVGPTAEGLHLLGQAAAAKGESDTARLHWENALELRANRSRMTNVAVLRQLVSHSEALGDEGAGAAERYRGLLAFELGKFALEQRDATYAQQQFNQATHHLPDHAPSWYYLGEVARFSGEMDEAEQAYRSCLEADPNHGRARAALARLVAAAVDATR